MTDEEVINYLTEKAPNIMWAVEEGEKIRGSAMVNGVMISDAIPLFRSQWVLDDISEAFTLDIEKKSNSEKE